MRTYVLNLKTIIKSLFVTAAFAAVAVFILSGQVMSFISDKVAVGVFRKENLIASFPVLAYESANVKRTPNSFMKIILNEELDNPDKVIAGGIPIFSGIKEKLSEIYVDVYESNFFYTPSKKEKTELPEIEAQPEIYRAPETSTPSIKPEGTSEEKKGITVKNHTGYSINIPELYKSARLLKPSKENVEILIVHTHGTESYNPTDRSEDTESNIVRVGTEMAKVFEKRGIRVTHSKTMHDIPRFNSSYGKSLITIEQEMKKNPNIKIVLDVHRDAMIADNGDSYKTVCEYNGEKVAQIMFVVGTDANGLTHPNWKENLKYAMRFQEAINKKCPNLAKPIDLRKERFNQHTSFGTLIIEVGTNGNTLEEAVKGGVLAAEAISDVMSE